MCDECHQSPHATMCPNNPALAEDHPIMKTCPICEREFPEEDMIWSVCDECIEKSGTRETAFLYGRKHKQKVEINGLLASVFSEDTINMILMSAMRDMVQALPDQVEKSVRGFVFEDSGDFADWLVEQKKGK